MEKTLAGLGSRVFLAHNVHEDAPVLFHARWAMSYLRGPLTRTQIAALMADRKLAAASATLAAAPDAGGARIEDPSTTGERPALPPSIQQLYLAARAAAGDQHRLVLRPALGGAIRLHFVSSPLKLDHWQDVRCLASLPEKGTGPEWSRLEPAVELQATPALDGGYAPLAGEALRERSYAGWRRRLEEHLYRTERLRMWKCPALKAVSTVGEDEGAFRGRLVHLAREKRDLDVEKMRRRYALRLKTLEDRVRRAEERVHKESEQFGGQKMDAVLAIGATLAGALFGRKLASVGNVTRTRSAIRGLGRASKERGDVARAEREVEAQREKLEDMEATLAEEIEGIEHALDASAIALEEVAVPPRKSDIEVSVFGLVWTPWRVDGAGIAEPLY